MKRLPTYLQLLRSADSNEPMMSRMHGCKKQLDAQFQSWLSGPVKNYRQLHSNNQGRDGLVRPSHLQGQGHSKPEWNLILIQLEI